MDCHQLSIALLSPANSLPPLPVSFADCSKAARELGWRAQRGLDDICRDAWHGETARP